MPSKPEKTIETSMKAGFYEKKYSIQCGMATIVRLNRPAWIRPSMLRSVKHIHPAFSVHRLTAS
jgi:hypothetical protein